MVKRHVLALLGAFAISVPAFAADTGGYLVGMFGQTKAKDIDTTGLTNVSVDDTDTGIKLGGGYAFHRNVAVEVAYVDLGKATASAGGQKIKVKLSGLAVGSRGLLTVHNQGTLFGKIGFF